MKRGFKLCPLFHNNPKEVNEICAEGSKAETSLLFVDQAFEVFFVRSTIISANIFATAGIVLISL